MAESTNGAEPGRQRANVVPAAETFHQEAALNELPTTPRASFPAGARNKAKHVLLGTLIGNIGWQQVGLSDWVPVECLIAILPWRPQIVSMENTNIAMRAPAVC